MPLDFIATDATNMDQNLVDARFAEMTRDFYSTSENHTDVLNDKQLSERLRVNDSNTGLIDNLKAAQERDSRLLVAEHIPQEIEKKYMLIEARTVTLARYREAELN